MTIAKQNISRILNRTDRSSSKVVLVQNICDHLRYGRCRKIDYLVGRCHQAPSDECLIAMIGVGSFSETWGAKNYLLWLWPAHADQALLLHSHTLSLVAAFRKMCDIFDRMSLQPLRTFVCKANPWNPHQHSALVKVQFQHPRAARGCGLRGDPRRHELLVQHAAVLRHREPEHVS